MSKLSEIAEINPRQTEMLKEGEIISFVPMSAVKAETASVDGGEERRYVEVKKGYTFFRNGDLLVAKITPCFENCKIAHAVIPRPFGFGSTEFHVIRPIAGKSEARYLLHYLRRQEIRIDGERKMTGSAGQKRVPAHYLAELEIPLPPLSEQQRIMKILDKAEELRAKRRAALAHLDSLAQSIFLDMFGDPATNRKGFPIKTIGELAEKYSDGPFGSNLKSSHYVDEGVRVIRLQNIGLGEFVDEDKAYISERHFEKLKKHECKPGDVLIGTLGDPNLRACLQPDWLKTALNKADCVQFRPNKSLVTASFICALLNQPAIENMAKSLTFGQTRLRISMGRLRGLKIPVPPLKWQNEFDKRLQVCNGIKKGLLNSLSEADVLFASLQHRAFRGEL